MKTKEGEKKLYEPMVGADSRLHGISVDYLADENTSSRPGVILIVAFIAVLVSFRRTENSFLTPNSRYYG